MMKRILFSAVLALAVLPLPLPVTALTAAAQAQTADHITIPLAIVRFNQPRVYFQRPLASAVKQAMMVDPAVSFTVVNYVPGGDSASRRRAEYNLRQVLNQLYSAGVAQGKVSVQTQLAGAMTHSEVHVYVR